MVQKVLVDFKGNRYYWDKGDLHTPYGIIKEKDILSGILKSHLGKEFYCYDAGFVDKLKKIKRGGPAVPVLKDIGLILAKIGLNRKSKVVDAGTGCGVLSSYLANISDDVTSYEINQEFYNISKENFKFLNVKVKQKLGDINQSIEEKNVDLITLDLPEPWLVLDHAYESLKSGGFLVCYLPTIVQVSNLMEKCGKKFIEDSVVELIEREWYVEGRKVRPKNKGLMHTAFLVFLRRV